jgi:glycosyltransferase involved in cell wall biosynthesis
VIRVAVITPILALGGVERVITMLAKFAPPEWCISTVLVLDPALYHTASGEQLARYTRLCHAGPLGDMPGCDFVGFDRAAAMTQTARESDVVMLVNFTDQQVFENVDFGSTPVLAVAHGQCEYGRKTMDVVRPFATHFGACSEAALDAIPDDLVEATTLLNNGIDLNRSAVAIHSREAMRASWGLASDDIAVLFLARFAPDKNPLAFGEAMSRLPSNYKAIYYGDGWKRDETIAEAKRLLGDRAIIRDPVEQVGDVFGASDVFFTASNQEGASLATLEAWSAGVPVVSKSVGVVPSVTRDFGRCCVLIHMDDDYGAQALAIVHAHSPEARRTIVANGRRAVAERFSLPKMIDAHTELFTRMVRERRGTA